MSTHTLVCPDCGETAPALITELETALDKAGGRELALMHQVSAYGDRIAELEEAAESRAAEGAAAPAYRDRDDRRLTALVDEVQEVAYLLTVADPIRNRELVHRLDKACENTRPAFRLGPDAARLAADPEPTEAAE